VIIDIRPDVEGMPTMAYVAVDEVEMEGKATTKVYKHIPVSIEAEEAEEVGVEHLLRDINDPSTSTLAMQIKAKTKGLAGLVERLAEIKTYLQAVVEGKVPVNHQIVYGLQDIFNLLPNLNVEALIKSLLVKTNDIHHAIYISSLVRSVIGLHKLLTNKIAYADVDDVLDRSAGVVVEGKGATEKDKKADPKDQEKTETPKKSKQ
jgi:26S proteasome regulatory subunit N8